MPTSLRSFAPFVAALLFNGVGCAGSPLSSSDAGDAAASDLSHRDAHCSGAANCPAGYSWDADRCECEPPDLGARDARVVDSSSPDLSQTGCAGLDETSCGSRKDCVVETCQLCACTPVFFHCRGMNQPPDSCPAVDCVGPACCHSANDCAPSMICIAPGASSGGACAIPEPCQSDADCVALGALMVCGVGRSPCQGATPGCVPGCEADTDCPDTMLCAPDHHCEQRLCASDADCPADFACTTEQAKSGTCARRACTSDGDCTGGNCVGGECYPGLGTCTFPAP